jgi:FKBP-type peptidyl-prolyl cis-trans isomerase
VHQDKSGFWYHVDYAGDGPLISADDSSIEVVVTEKLADGTLVEDMDASGRSLTMALVDFPPLFHSALVLMRNHGSMTLVAPPQLAYGDAGYPPKVPPGATMVYTLRVDNVKPAPEIALPDVKETNVAGSGKPTRSEQK